MGCGVYVREYSVSTNKRFEVVKITELVENTVKESGIRNGYVLVFAPHATAAVIVNEYEPNVASDYLEWIKKYVPPDYEWRHNTIDNNAHAHIASSIIGASRIFPLIDGRLVRGVWQEIMLLELDGPRRSRRIVVEVMGS